MCARIHESAKFSAQLARHFAPPQLSFELRRFRKHTVMTSWGRARGAVLGTLIGDAAGVPLEGATEQQELTEARVQEALQFPGCDRAGRYQVVICFEHLLCTSAAL